MKRLKIGINGFGRIGRAFTRIAVDRGNFDIVAVNTRQTAPEMLAYLLKYDSVYRTFGKSVEAKEGALIVDGQEIKSTQIAEPENIPWDEYGVDVVIEATGAFTIKPDLQKHKKDGVKYIVLSAPAKDENTDTVVLGVNDEILEEKDLCEISNASCTTNCVAPLFKVIDDNYEIESGFVTTAHAYTSSQSLLDESNKKPDRSRAAALNIIPSTTGAARAVARVIPRLAGRLDGMAIRVPVPTVSFADISAVVKKSTTVDEVNAAFLKAANGPMKGILHYETQPLVSSDYIGSTYSSIFDSNYTKVLGGTLIKVFGWYDNEWGYSARLVDLVEKLARFV